MTITAAFNATSQTTPNQIRDNRLRAVRIGMNHMTWFSVKS